MALSGVAEAPGRVNLIGEHIDYHRLPVLPIALDRRVRVEWRRRDDHTIRASSAGFEPRSFEWTPQLAPVAAGDWENYVRAAAQTVAARWGAGRGIDAAVHSTLPAAAGLSSSSALIVAVTLALLEANGIAASFEELMDVLPEGEHFVGTRGGGMDHAASLGSQAGCASLIEFAPLRLTPVPLPPDWVFLVADSGKVAEKSGAVRDEYNARRTAGAAAPAKLGFASYSEATVEAADHLEPGRERDAYLHVVTEARRVREAVDAIGAADAPRFGRLLSESHASLRHRLRVSCPELDRLVEAALAAGAPGARLTGAGFGGCAVAFSTAQQAPAVRAALAACAPSAILEAVPSDGALLLASAYGRRSG